MTDEHDPQMLSSSSSAFRYEVAPYRAPGTFAVPRLLVCLLTVVLLAFGLGWCVHWLDTWLENIEWAWTLGLGFAMGLLGATAVHAARVRHGGLAALLGLVGGGLCLVAMHYWKYRDTLPVYDDRARAWAVEVVAADLAARANPVGVPGLQRVAPRQTPPSPKPHPPDRIIAIALPVIQEQLSAGKVDKTLLPKAVDFLIGGGRTPAPSLGEPIDDAVRSAVARFGFLDYMNWKATKGVPLSLPKMHKPIHLGYTGSLIYWGIELLIAGGIAAGIFWGVSQQPACSNCDDWLNGKPIGRLRLEPDRGRQVFTQGTLLDLAGEDLASPDGAVLVKVHTCESCGEEAAIIVQLFQMTKNDRGKDEQSQLTEPLVYPGSALAVLQAMVEPPPAEPSAAAPPS